MIFSLIVGIMLPTLIASIGTTKFLVAGMIVNLIGCLIRMVFAKNIVMHSFSVCDSSGNTGCSYPSSHIPVQERKKKST